MLNRCRWWFASRTGPRWGRRGTTRTSTSRCRVSRGRGIPTTCWPCTTAAPISRTPTAFGTTGGPRAASARAGTATRLLHDGVAHVRGVARAVHGDRLEVEVAVEACEERLARAEDHRRRRDDQLV